MSDDLISRKMVLEKLKVFSDRKNGNEHFLFGIETAIEIIENEPVAFDKEMVIKELEYDKEMSKKHSTGLREQGHVEAFDEAIYVVKKGGIHNLLP